ncbi:MAG: hypothetical protein P4L53_15680 [Candidatus Obscuribacterales bacterium]|nr:hypothetical protein [Candidatus Obscuribacterales bacterium]
MSQTEQIKPAAIEQSANVDKNVQRLSSAHLIVDFAKSAVQTGLISPLWNGAAGAIVFGHLPKVSIVDSESARTSPAEAMAQTLGAAAGLAADAVILSKVHALFFRGAATEAVAHFRYGGQKSFSPSLLSESLSSNHSLSLLAKDSEALAGEAPAEKMGDPFAVQGTSLARIQRHIANEARPAAKYIARVISENDVTMIGEFHNRRGPSPHRLLGVEALSELPPGSTLAVEFPASFKPIFDEFNAAEPGTDFNLSSPLVKSLSQQRALKFLQVLPHDNPEILDLWKSVRDRGSRVVPIDADFDTYGGHYASSTRERTLSEQLIALHREDVSKPVVAWSGNFHGARANLRDFESFAKQLAQAPEFASGRSKLSTIYSQIAESETKSQPLYAVANRLNEPLAFPTFRSKPEAEQPFASVGILPPGEARTTGMNVKLGDYDHVVMYPPATAEQTRAFFRKQFDNSDLVEDRFRHWK